jgi:hypothetical protein
MQQKQRRMSMTRIPTRRDGDNNWQYEEAKATLEEEMIFVKDY